MGQKGSLQLQHEAYMGRDTLFDGLAEHAQALATMRDCWALWQRHTDPSLSKGALKELRVAAGNKFATRLLEAQNNTAVVPVLEAVLQLDPTNPLASAYLGIALKLLEEYERAVPLLMHALDHEPSVANNLKF